MPADLTHDTSGPGAVTYGLECAEHPDHARRGLTQAHATNAVAKHNRDHHDADPKAASEVNVTAAAQALVAFLADDPEDASALQRSQSLSVRVAAVEVLEALTGLHGLAAIARGQDWAETHPAITAHVAPF